MGRARLGLRGRNAPSGADLCCWRLLRRRCLQAAAGPVRPAPGWRPTRGTTPGLLASPLTYGPGAARPAWPERPERSGPLLLAPPPSALPAGGRRTSAPRSGLAPYAGNDARVARVAT